MDLQILKNNLLFNHTYLKELTADTTIDPQIPFSPKVLRDWYSFLDTSSTRTMVDTWVRPMLSLLELEIHALDSDDEHAFKLTTAYDHTLAIGACYVAPPGADLDTTTKGRFWMAQAVLSARRHAPALRWVILTNGDLWRLLDAQALRRYEAYVQIDVGQLARGASDPSALRVFFRCFHRSAFEKIENKTGLAKLLEASDHATEKAEKHLKELITGTDGIMAQLSLGLVRSTGKSKFSEEERDAIYRDATTLLYRMLFLLYAESRQLLPIDNPKYAEVSMAGLVETARLGQQRGMDRPQGTSIWERLKRLCNAIYESDPVLDIPAYNGGLFDDDDHPFLRNGYIADQYLSRALYNLTFLPNGNDIQAIDYRDLSVRHLGSLYEGMIEYKLFVAEEPMLARRDKGGIIHFMTQQEGGGLRRNDQEIKTSEVYFAQNSGERRATGTYYTPEYVVDYIVRNTVIKGLEERRTHLEEKLKGWLDEIYGADMIERPSLHRAVDEEMVKFVVEQVLTFTVCDPAIGSGHFLVNSIHNIANFVVETFTLTVWENEKLNADTGYWRRRAAERCLYGVDISEMAVELAKLSLWLATMSKGKPLSFLKHHLLQGNSLIGARIDDLAMTLKNAKPLSPSPKEKRILASGQLSMLDYPAFTRNLNSARQFLRKITSQVVETIFEIRTQEADYEQFRSELAPYRILADVAIGKFFGLKVNDSTLQKLAFQIFEQGGKPTREYWTLISEAEKISKDLHFLHWDLEFLVDFANQRNNLENSLAKFDVVVANPPYLDGRNIDDVTLKYLKRSYQTSQGKVNAFNIFMERAITLLKPNGRCAMILPSTIMRNERYWAVRKYLLEHTHINTLAIPTIPVFDQAVVEPIIVSVSTKITGTPTTVVEFDLEKFTEKNQVDSRSWLKNASYFWNLSSDGLSSLFKRIENKSSPLGDLGQIKDGISTGFKPTPERILGYKIDNQFCALDATSMPFDKGIHKPIIDGGEFSRFSPIEWEERYIWYDKKHEQIPPPPKGKPFNCQLREQWIFETRPRLIYRQTADNLICTILLDYFYTRNSIHNFILAEDSDVSLEYIAALFNSRLLTWIYRLMTQETGKVHPQVHIKHTRLLPIRKIDFITENSLKGKLIKDGIDLFNCINSTNEESHFLEFIESCLNHKPEQSDIIHDLLSFLAKQMFLMKTNMRTDMKSFLSWIESRLGTRINNLTGKSYLQNFLGDYQKNEAHLEANDLIEILNKNNRRLTGDPSDRRFQLELKERYQECLDSLLPIQHQIAMVDRMIDQIVYRLYGLSKEEIIIVEGKA